MPVSSTPTSKNRILAAAFDEFTEHGFHGARVDRIAERAEVNKSLLYQSVGDKEELFRCVLEAKLTEMSTIPIDPERIVETAGEMFDFAARNPWLVRLLLWEALDFGTGPIPNEDERQQLTADRVGVMCEAQRLGVLDPDLDPRHTLVTLMGIVTYWFACPQVARMACGGDPYSAEELASRRQHVQTIVRKILEA